MESMNMMRMTTVKKLKKMFRQLSEARDGSCRYLCVLTRNGNTAGVQGVLNLLKIAGLDEYFTCIWLMPFSAKNSNGQFKDGDGVWQLYDPPIGNLPDHKADWLAHLAEFPEKWFPQLSGTKPEKFAGLSSMKLASIVLVDDERMNFQSATGASVLRYSKVARYDAEYHNLGMINDMGGIGALNPFDYETLAYFVDQPALYKETLQVRCHERDFDESGARKQVKLIAFDFDETLTLATFMPSSPEAATSIGWKPQHDSSEAGDEWTEADLIAYNFESPWVEGSRVEKLRAHLAELAKKSRLAVLTFNECGAVAVLNLLMMAGLADHFSVIWCIGQAARSSGSALGAFQDTPTIFDNTTLHFRGRAILDAEIESLLNDRGMNKATRASMIGQIARQSMRISRTPTVRWMAANF